jgi:hypothetical protein
VRGINFRPVMIIFGDCKAKTFCLASFLARKKNEACHLASIFFLSVQESSPKKSFCFRMMKNYQHQHKGKPHTQEKSQDAATSMEDAIADTVHPNGFET